jgi:hypothetical protein
VTREDFPIRWDPDLVWQGLIGPSEVADLIDADGGAWAVARPEGCGGGHTPRLHPCEDGSFYCIVCGEEDIEPPGWATRMLRQIRDA